MQAIRERLLHLLSRDGSLSPKSILTPSPLDQKKDYREILKTPITPVTAFNLIKKIIEAQGVEHQDSVIKQGYPFKDEHVNRSITLSTIGNGLIEYIQIHIEPAWMREKLKDKELIAFWKSYAQPIVTETVFFGKTHPYNSSCDALFVRYEAFLPHPRQPPYKFYSFSEGDYITLTKEYQGETFTRSLTQEQLCPLLNEIAINRRIFVPFTEK